MEHPAGPRRKWIPISTSGAGEWVLLRFFCPELRLAIEVDGVCHAGQEEADYRRVAALHKLGIKVIRVTAEQLAQESGWVQLWLQEVCDARKFEIELERG